LHAVGETIDGFGFQARPTAHVVAIGDLRKKTKAARLTPHFSGTTCASPTRFSYTTLPEDKHGCAEIRGKTQIRESGIKAR
jgi:hypothetical protein